MVRGCDLERWRWKSALVLLFVPSAMLLLRCGEPREETTAPTTATARFHERYEVTLPLTGVLAAIRTTAYSSSVPNRSLKVTWLAPEGVLVAAGDPLVRFDPGELEQESNEQEQKVADLERDLAGLEKDFTFDQLALEEALAEARLETRRARKARDHFRDDDGPAKLKQLANEETLAILRVSRLERESEDLAMLNQRGYATDFELAALAEKLTAARFRAEKAAFEHARFKSHGRADELADYNHEAELAERKELLISTRLEQLQNQYRQRRERLDGAIARKKRDLEALRRYLTQTTLRADHAGLVTYDRTFKQGRKLKPAVGFEFRMNQTILSVQDVAALRAETRISEFLVKRIDRGMAVRLVADADQSAAFSGSIGLIGLLAERREDEAEKAFDVQIEIPQPPDGLRPGMSVRCEVITDTYEDVWALPSAVLQGEGAAYCQVRREGRLIAVQVDVLDVVQQTALLRGQLETRDRVVLHDGLAVR